MRTQFKKKRFWGRWVIPVLSVACFSYFGYHSWHGAYGLDSAEALEIRRVELTERLASLEERRQHLERKVMLLSDGAVEADMLDERARALLNVARADEVVYFN
ncbi:septum formation initiator family protein [Hoeflea sp. YIM 152468]|uniref:FtsB family cell division protein n=1 Tax=Hoeflea sp. YIM 152468 TaxID=3031759 RepID=UPI0023DA31A2|nr:septum formation initiator family protein [Hoeflea sp. YIM 152468]MDF1608920.1 septum formation initiator family protein [Hoeflea sp. YIM 152468]